MNIANDSSSKNANNNYEITSEAASWLAQLDSGALSPQDKLALAEWMSRSPKHRQELRRLEAVWSDTDNFLNHVLKSQSSASLSNVAAAWVSIRPTQALVTAMLMAICLSFAVGTWLTDEDASLANIEPSIESTFTYQAERGQMRVVALNDGSVAYLNSNAVAEIRYTRENRQVRLVSGEALFEVVKDTKRPFRVYAGNARVEAMGTAFMVKRIDSDLELIVTKGRVKLDNVSFDAALGQKPLKANAGLSEVIVEHGQRVLSRDIQNVMPIDEQAVVRHTAWIQGKHIFEGDTLKFIVEELSRHSSKQIVIADPSLGELKLGGVFTLGDVDTFLSTLTQTLEVRVKQVDEKLFYVEPLER